MSSANALPSQTQQAEKAGETDVEKQQPPLHRVGTARDEQRPSYTTKATEKRAKRVPSSPSAAFDATAPPLQHSITAVSAITNHDIASALPSHPVADDEENDDIYNRLPLHRKHIITCVLAFCGFLAPISSTTVLAAVPEVAETYHCDGSIINLSNAFYMLFMGISPMFWGPLGQVYGRRWNSIISAALLFAFSVGTALAPNLASFFVFRILTAFQGTSFLILGSSCIGDIFRPTERATALGWFMSGTLIGPAFGPFIGGIIVTFRSWRDIFWLQSALAGLGCILVFFLLPETIHYKRSVELRGLPRRKQIAKMWHWTNPLRVISLYKYPNLIAVGMASSALVWNMYSLLTPIRYVLNPRFNLTSPIQSGLFYIAPGCGYLLGTFFGGRWADYHVKKYIAKKGRRVPEDRLRSCLIALGGIVPACMILYGWSVEKRVGGIALPVVATFIQGVAQLICFPCLNTYCLDVMQSRSSEVIAGNYMVRYLFAALGSALCLPAIRKIGVGWFSTLSAFFLIAGAVAVHFTTIYGEKARLWIDDRKLDSTHEHEQEHEQEEGDHVGEEEEERRQRS